MGAWGFGEPGPSGPQNHPLLAPLVQFASPTPIFQTSCPLLSLPPAPPAGVEVSRSSVCHDGPIVLPLGVSPHIRAPQFSCGALNRHSHGVSLPPIRLICLLLLLLLPGEFGGWPQSDSFGRDGYQCVGGHHCLGEEWGRAENPPNSCLKSGPTLAGGWTENSPP